MTFRSDGDALHARLDALEHELAEARCTVEQLKSECAETSKELQESRARVAALEQEREAMRKQQGERVEAERKRLVATRAVTPEEGRGGPAAKDHRAIPWPPGTGRYRNTSPIIVGLFIVGVCALAIVFLAGGPKKRPTVTSAGRPPGARPAKARAVPAQFTYPVELHPYLYCLDGIDLDLRLGWADYRQGIAPAEKRCSPEHVDQIFATENGARCLKLLKDGGEKLALSKEAQAYREALERMLAIAATVTRYYALGDFKDDDFAKGQELDGEMQRAYALFQSASDKLRRAVAPLRAARLKQTLALVLLTPSCQQKQCFAYWEHGIVADATRLVHALLLEETRLSDFAAAVLAFAESQLALEAFWQRSGGALGGKAYFFYCLRTMLSIAKEAQREWQAQRPLARVAKSRRIASLYHHLMIGYQGTYRSQYEQFLHNQ